MGRVRRRTSTSRAPRAGASAHSPPESAGVLLGVRRRGARRVRRGRLVARARRRARRPAPGSRGRRSRVFLVQHVLFAGFPTRLWAASVGDGLDPRLARLLGVGEPPHGSNAFAVGGARPTSGLPLIGADPHRVFEVPGSTSRSVSRATSSMSSAWPSPGVPGVQHFGHTGHVAWAVTNAMADYQDVRVVDGRLEVRTPTAVPRRRRAGRPAAAAAGPHRRGRRRRARPLGGAGQQRPDRRHGWPGAAPGGRPGAGAHRRRVDGLGPPAQDRGHCDRGRRHRQRPHRRALGRRSSDASRRPGGATGSARSSRSGTVDVARAASVLTDEDNTPTSLARALLLDLTDLPEPSRRLVEQLREWDRSMRARLRRQPGPSARS